MTGNTFPNFNFNDGVTNVANIGSSTNNDTIDNGYRLNDGVTKTFGRHTLTIGWDFRYQKFFPLSLNNQTGFFNFSRNETSFAQGFQGQTELGLQAFCLARLIKRA